MDLGGIAPSPGPINFIQKPRGLKAPWVKNPDWHSRPGFLDIFFVLLNKGRPLLYPRPQSDLRYIYYCADDRFELPRLDHESSMLPLHQPAKLLS